MPRNTALQGSQDKGHACLWPVPTLTQLCYDIGFCHPQLGQRHLKDHFQRQVGRIFDLFHKGSSKRGVLIIFRTKTTYLTIQYAGVEDDQR